MTSRNHLTYIDWSIRAPADLDFEPWVHHNRETSVAMAHSLLSATHDFQRTLHFLTASSFANMYIITYGQTTGPTKAHELEAGFLMVEDPDLAPMVFTCSSVSFNSYYVCSGIYGTSSIPLTSLRPSITAPYISIQLRALLLCLSSAKSLLLRWRLVRQIVFPTVSHFWHLFYVLFVLQLLCLVSLFTDLKLFIVLRRVRLPLLRRIRL